jgi:hypothetical protein
MPAVRTAEWHTLDDVRVRVVSAPYFVATKLEAFAHPDRGAGDFWGSHDIEDIVTLMDGRSELVGEVEAAAPDVCEYISRTLATALSRGGLADAVAAHLPPDVASQQRAPIVLSRLQRIAALSR